MEFGECTYGGIGRFFRRKPLSNNEIKISKKNLSRKVAPPERVLEHVDRPRFRRPGHHYVIRSPPRVLRGESGNRGVTDSPGSCSRHSSEWVRWSKRGFRRPRRARGQRAGRPRPRGEPVFLPCAERRESRNHWKDRRSRSGPRSGGPQVSDLASSAQSRAMEAQMLSRGRQLVARPNGFSISTPASSIPSIPKATTATTRGAA